MPLCKFCGTDIFWMKEGRKNRPFNQDGGPHQCEEMEKSLKSTKLISPNSLSPEELKAYQDKINQAFKKSKR
jgi:hypothetical protein